MTTCAAHPAQNVFWRSPHANICAEQAASPAQHKRLGTEVPHRPVLNLLAPAVPRPQPSQQ